MTAAPGPQQPDEVRQSIRATYDSAVDGLPYHVTTRVGDRTVSFQEPTADPFVRTTVVVPWRDALRELVRHRAVRVTVLVGGDRERVRDVLELDDQTLIAGRSRHAAFHAHVRERLGSRVACTCPPDFINRLPLSIRNTEHMPTCPAAPSAQPDRVTGQGPRLCAGGVTRDMCCGLPGACDDC